MPEVKRLPIIAANWKMHKVHTEAIQFAQKLHYLLEEPALGRVEVVVAAPFTDLRTLQTLFDMDRMPFHLGAQNVYWEEKGAFTGEIAPAMLVALGVDYVIVGHSERRQIFGETDEMVAKKVQVVFQHGMTPILCCGETLDEREAGGAEAKVKRQIAVATDSLSAEQAARLVVAYEPIWAIGTGRNAGPDDAEDMCGMIRNVFGDVFGGDVSNQTRIQYGGSVKSGNIEMLMHKPDIDGALVGGASLDPEEFARILTQW